MSSSYNQTKDLYGAAEQPYAAMNIHFLHTAPTPHNNYLLDAVASLPDVELHRHYLLKPTAVPGRAWKGLSTGEVQKEHIHCGYGLRIDWRLVRLALTDRRSVFFVIGWDYPVLVLVLLILGLRRRPLLMWDDGPSPDSLAKFLTRPWQLRQIMKRLLVTLINRTPGTYFHTGAAVRRNVLALGVAERKLADLPFFVRPGQRYAALRAAYGCDAETTLILAGGRLVPSKGYDVFIEALGQLRGNAHRPWRAVLIGSGPEQTRLHVLAADLGLQRHLYFVGWAESDVFADHVHSCDVFVAPARFDHFPTTVISALQAGVAVVATDGTGSAVEFIDDGYNGLQCPAGQVEPLAAHLERLVDDPVARQRLAEAGRETMAGWPVERGAQMIIESASAALKACAD